MKKYICAILISLLLHDFAQAFGTYLYQGFDITNAVHFFETKVKTLKKPVSVYNWSVGGDLGDYSEHLSNAKKLSRSFWTWYGDKGEGSMYGYGLYAAVDPVASNSFGYGNDWVLFEMKFPIGFKLIDLTLDYFESQQSISEDLVTLGQKFNCPSFAKLDPFFANGGAEIDIKCRGLIKKIFKDIIQIDGFAYGYSQTNFKACKKSDFTSSRAFVVTDEKWMRFELIHFYNSKTTDSKENRIRIQTLFFVAALDLSLKLTDESTSLMSTYLVDHPETQLHGTKTECTGDLCKLIVLFCDPNNKCDEVNLGYYLRPGGPTITASEAKRTQRGVLLWNDLEGQPKSTTTSEWLIDNKFACSGELPY
jgi:hypothetical protein